jgi:hypothetical protein
VDMPHYFSREEAEALLPQLSVVLRKIRQARRQLVAAEDELNALRIQAMGNGHHLHERVVQVQREMTTHIERLGSLVGQVQAIGCELKDPDMGLVDFLSLRNGQEVYLCWRLGEDRIRYWHYLHTGFAGRQPL